MLDRYTDAARQVIFHARYEASEIGPDFMDTEHLLLGLVHIDPTLLASVSPPLSLEWVREFAAHWHVAMRTKVPTWVDMPLSKDVHQALKSAETFAADHGSRYIRTEHLLLALASLTSSHAAVILERAGLGPDHIRSLIADMPNRRGAQAFHSPERPHGPESDGT